MWLPSAGAGFLSRPGLRRCQPLVPESVTPPGSLSWDQLQALAPPEPDRVLGLTNAQAQLRLFCSDESAVRVTLYRDHHAWCPYCQKVWLWLEEQQIPYRIRKVTMNCYGDKEGWYRQRVPSGMLPALELDGRLITESDAILAALEAALDEGLVQRKGMSPGTVPGRPGGVGLAPAGAAPVSGLVSVAVLHG